VTGEVTLRPYDANTDESGLWALKREFELELGTATGGDDKADVYADKLTSRYRTRWLAWVDRCVDDDPGCVLVADAGRAVADAEAGSEDVDAEAGGNSRSAGGEADARIAGSGASPSGLVGYAFLLPESLSFVWDAAVLNEIYAIPGRRGTGVADALLDAVVEHARTQDLPLDRVVLDVDAENGRAYSFYRRHGFEPWGEMVAREL
jgi:ribosomal protein S18 acetylase RimI-like enzyme